MRTWKNSHGKEHTITAKDMMHRADEFELEGNLVLARVFRNAVHIHLDAKRREERRLFARGFLRLLRP